MTRGRGPLAGLKVLDLTRLLPGGFCSLLLADFGADVVKVEDTGMGDYVRWAPPFYEGAEESAKSALFLALNRGKRSIRLNLKEERGREVFLRLAREHDVLIESFRPGVLDRLGVGYERLREENAGLVYCAITGYGQDGPYRDRSGHDMNYLGLIGLLDLTGEPDGPPIQAAGQIADIGGGALMAAFGILAAVRERERSGEGQLVDVSMSDGALSWLALVAGRLLCDGVVPGRGQLELAGKLVCYRPYACEDGWVTLGALEPKFWQAWCRGVGREDLIDKQFDEPGSEAHAEVERIFLERTREEWREFASQHDCCLEPVLNLAEALDSELVRAREMLIEVEQPGAGPVRQLGVPIKLGRTPGAARGPGSGLGEHTHDVLASIGYSDAEIEELETVGAVAGPPAPEAVSADASEGRRRSFRA
jgi:alpha-methylacyl-CoA racemase